MDLTEAEAIKKWWQEYKKNYTKKGLNNQNSQTFWSGESSGPWEAFLQTKVVEMSEFQLSYLQS